MTGIGLGAWWAGCLPVGAPPSGRWGVADAAFTASGRGGPPTRARVVGRAVGGMIYRPINKCILNSSLARLASRRVTAMRLAITNREHQ